MHTKCLKEWGTHGFEQPQLALWLTPQRRGQERQNTEGQEGEKPWSMPFCWGNED